MACKGTCHRYKAKWIAQTFRYASGQKRCNSCEIFVSWDGKHCPCCGMMLRTRSRVSRYRENVIDQPEQVTELSK